MTAAGSDEDDIWASDEDSGILSGESLEVKKVHQTHYKRGYLDGISSAKEENLQAGFDEKFPFGSQLGFRVGKIVGQFQLLVTLYGNTNPNLIDALSEIKRELRINKVLANKHFEDDFGAKKSLEELLQLWENRLEESKTKACS